MSDLIGRKLGQYEITALLGEGGMARVYRAHQSNVKRDVAIKVIESRLAHNPDFIKRFEREAQMIAALNHPHILKLFDFGQQNDLLYLVMELQPGGSLQQLIRARRGLTPDTAARFLDQIAGALDYAHQHSVIHRDLKPQNVLLDESGNAILTDFGIARLVGEGAVTALTGTGMALGTPAYMPPEQWYGRNIDSRSDEYALGVMAFEMLTGQLPFDGDTPPALMQQHINEPPRSLRTIRPELPQSLERVILKALAKAPDDRFQSAGELATAVRAAMPHEDSEPESATQDRQGIWVWGAMVIIALIGVVVILLSGRGGGALTPTASTSATAPLIAANPSETTAPRATSTFTPTATDTATATFTSTATETAVPTATHTGTTLLSLASSETLDPIQAAETLFFAGLTQTAALWTATPTETFTPSPNFTKTVEARLTAIVVASYTNVTALPNTLTFTPTPIPSNAPTFTLTPTITFTSTHTPTLTFTPSHTPTVTLTPQPTLIPAETSNAVWMPVERDFDGVMMVLVPSGCFKMGTDNGPSNEKPVHEVCLDEPFWIDQTEVTQVQFKRLWGKAENGSYFTGDNRPVEQIAWFEARDFCTLRGSRLPTEAEWEYAARGPESLTYPWGNTFDADKVVYAGNSGGQTDNVGSIPSGVSWLGALDLSGNVAEWTSSLNQPYPYQANDGREMDTGTRTDVRHMVRGGSWRDFGADVRTTDRNGAGPNLRDATIGFRCARSYE